MVDEPFRTLDGSGPPVPKELEEVILALNDLTLRNIMSVCSLGVGLAEKYPESRRGIANRLRGLFYDYDVLGDDDDIYRLRYARLVPDIEEKLDLLSTYLDEDAMKAGKTLTQHWVGLKWLVEDQQKIIG